MAELRLTNPWAIGAILALTFVVLAVLFVPRRRSFLRLLPGLFLIVVPVILLVGAIGSVIAAQDDVDLRIRQAAIAAGVVASGWVVSFLLQEYRRADERDERIRDMHRAIYADIASYLDAWESPAALNDGLKGFLDALKNDPAFVPVLSPPRPSQMFTALSGQIHVLPRVTIDLIVLFYSQRDTLEDFVRNLNADRFTALPRDRRRRAYIDYYEMLEFAYWLGEAALKTMTAYDKSGAKAAAKLADNMKFVPQINIRAADQSAPRQG